ncbi:MAG: S41 family peptidase [Gammaproteobacteria bacterium]|nr:S41 family peptidase [Gammaproteobacteria bacterium]
MIPRKARGFLTLALGVAIGLALGTARGVFAQKPAPLGADLPWHDAQMFALVLDRVERDYVEPVRDHRLLQAAIRGMVASLDPYSEYLNRDQSTQLRINSSGEYSGVGLEVSMQDDEVVVVSVFDGSPAAAAGVRPGDVVATIDGTPVTNASLAETIDRLRGKSGTTVRIGVLRGTNDTPIEFTVKRGPVEMRSVRSLDLAPGIGYLRIAEFTQQTGPDAKAALQSLLARNHGSLRGLVLDLRENPGGVLDAAASVADDFLNGGVIVSARGRAPDANFQMDATPGDLLGGAPIVVLVDGGSASAAEIVAGALKDHHRATLMGQRTFGKGSVQTVMPLPGGRALKLTTSLYYTPSGVSINHTGLLPDIVLPPPPPAARGVPSTPAGIRADPEVRRAVEELRQLRAKPRRALSATRR